MMMAHPYSSYKQADIGTADRGKLILMVYDHCIKWINKAEQDMDGKDMLGVAEAVQKAQRGLNELMATLNMEQGGDIAKNLFRLYDYYSRSLSQAIRDRATRPLREVSAMMTRLREAWYEAIEKLRRESRGTLSETARPTLSLVR
jgi:flagellar protein FliS